MLALSRGCAYDLAMSWNEKALKDIVSKHPELEGKSESVALAVWALSRNPETTPDEMRELSKVAGVNVAGRAIGSAKQILGISSPKPKAKKKAAKGRPGRPPKNRRPAADLSGGSLSQLVEAVQGIEADRAELEATLREIRNLIDRALPR